MRSVASRRKAHPIERQWRDVRGFRTVARREESRRAVALLAVASSLMRDAEESASNLTDTGTDREPTTTKLAVAVPSGHAAAAARRGT